MNAPLIVLKEFSAQYRDSLQCLLHHGFARVPSMPNTRLNIDYANGEGLDLLGIWRGASFAVIHQTGFGEPSKGAPHGSEITCFASDP
jgi:hypothetical protein